ncbi:translation machinery-associated protein 16 [Penicillium riverlandense]|uniref:translation machinery-associated protein 16 n=1 Tax=Penicillium riverlandense TaxID=1903569 RepID=UPI0025482A17|nr:translation machinery-associated protein 16 [Penicillium riverlandense]KAJ5820103.1 translation machinery-associated protein 16 [Penicillium riverlandense]
MAKTLQKVHKKISKKRGKVDSLNENSRDAQRLRRAGARDDRLSRHAKSTLKGRQPYICQAAIKPEQALSNQDDDRYINRDADEIEQLQQERRKGRPPSKREETLKLRTDTEEGEFRTGFWMPDLGDGDVLAALKSWNGDWSGLSTLKFVRFTKDGGKQTSSFPPKGMS